MDQPTRYQVLAAHCHTCHTHGGRPCRRGPGEFHAARRTHAAAILKDRDRWFVPRLDLPIDIIPDFSKLVPLNEVQAPFWKGALVYHPMSQSADGTTWTYYDVGIVLEVFEDPDFPDLDEPFRTRVRMLTEHGKLHYGAWNVWTMPID